MFQKQVVAAFKLKPSKCELFQWQIAYLGHVISPKGIAMDEGKIEAIKKWPIPKNITKVWSFLGFMGYYRQFIPKFMQSVQPLHELTLGENTSKKKAAIQLDNRPLMTWRDCVPLHLFLLMQISPNLSSSTLMLVGLAWELFSTTPMKMAQMP